MKMKDSGVEWIGEIPDSWNIVPTKRKFSNSKEIVGDRLNEFERLSLTLNGVLKRPSDDANGLQPENLATYQILYKDELVFKLIDLENVKTSRVGYSPYTGLVSPVYIRLSNSNESRFGYYYFTNMWHQEVFNFLGSGVRSNLNANDLLNIPYLDVPNSEQQKISDFLDEKTTLIDDIIADMKLSIDELKAYKQSMITEIVTKGLNPDVPMKDSGVEWIGEVPEAWNKYFVGQVFNQVKHKNIGMVENNLLSLSYGKIKKRDINSGDGLLPESFEGYNIVEKQDIILRMTDLQNDHTSLRQGIASERGIVTSAYITIRSTENIEPRFGFYQFFAFDTNKGYYGMGSGVRQGVNYSDIKKLTLVAPNLSEQQKIADFLDKKSDEIDQLILDKQKIVSEYETYKKSLIYEYVTGKKQIKE